MCVCVRVRVCLRVCVCAHACVCVCVRPIEILTCGKVPYTSHVHTNGVLFFFEGFIWVYVSSTKSYIWENSLQYYVHMSMRVCHTYAYVLGVGGGGGGLRVPSRNPYMWENSLQFPCTYI